uniref:Uncharacterized protein n=1 Tax=Ananas comosus var. bracteatus TaxID=296719 RepID=A0A6V7PDV2_ANACO|nr:unnamed protein product [Ananas comosus var. bracteatus]
MNQSVCTVLQDDGSVPFSFVISNGYNDFEYFFSNVLPHLTKFQSLLIGYESSSSASSFGISVKYEGSRQNNLYRCLEMKIRIDLLPECVKPRLSDWLRGLKSLSLLSISGGPTVEYLSAEVLQSLSSLRKLIVEECGRLTSFAGGKGALVKLNCLQELEIHDCVDLHSLPADLHELESLVYLRISRCPKLECLPDRIPSSLKILSIINCSQLKDRCRKNDGEDWHKIAHIGMLFIE